ncbi:MAG: hypothetical protein AAGG08_11155, partial [Actinomycetota bacterium]
EAASDAIADAIEALVDRRVPVSEETSLLDDATGVAEAADRLGGIADGAIAEGGAVVFVTPAEAWFEYDLLLPVVGVGQGDPSVDGDDASFASYGVRIGRAVLVDGTWRVTRGTMCDLLAFAGVACEPAWISEVPPR